MIKITIKKKKTNLFLVYWLSFVILSALNPAIVRPVFATGGYYTNDVIDENRYIDKYFEIDKNGQWKINIFLGSQKISTIDNTGTTTYPLVDHLGSLTIITNQDGNIVEKNEYDTFGTIIYATSTIANKDKFTGKSLDNETNLQYFDQRYLSNNTGRFSSIDPALFKLHSEQGFANTYQRSLQSHLANPQNLNSYSYSVNNPVSVIDKDGQIAIPALLGLIGVDFLFNINKAVAPGNNYNQSQALQHQTNDFPSLVSKRYNNLSDSQKFVGMMLMTGGISGAKNGVNKLAQSAEEDVVKLYHGTGFDYGKILKEGFSKVRNLNLTDSITTAFRYAEGWGSLFRDKGVIDIEIPKKIFNELIENGHIGPDPKGFIDIIYNSKQYILDDKAIEIINKFIK